MLLVPWIWRCRSGLAAVQRPQVASKAFVAIIGPTLNCYGQRSLDDQGSSTSGIKQQHYAKLKMHWNFGIACQVMMICCMIPTQDHVAGLPSPARIQLSCSTEAKRVIVAGKRGASRVSQGCRKWRGCPKSTCLF